MIWRRGIKNRHRSSAPCKLKRTKKADNSTTYNEYIRHGNTGERKTLRMATIA